MPGFLYYVPNASRGISREELCGLGLGYALGRTFTAAEILANGPDGGRGVIVADPRRVEPARIRMEASQQRWRKAVSYWVGHYISEPPGPADLLKSPAIAGHAVVLGDDREWICPVARLVHGEPALPRASELDEEGRWRPGPVLERYRRLWEVACAWWDTLLKGEVVETPEAGGETGPRLRFDFSGLHEAAIECLQAQYAIGATEAAMLGLLNEQVASAVLNAAVDWPVLKEWLEKKAKAAGPAAAAT